MKFSEARISTKMTLTFSLVVLMMLGLTALSLLSMHRMYEANEVVGHNSVPSLNALSEIKEHIGRLHIGEIKAAFGQRTADNASFTSSFDAIQKATAQYLELIDSHEERQLFTDVQRSLDDWQQLHTHLMALIAKEARQEAIALMETQAHQHFERLDQQIDRLGQYLNDDTQEAIEDTVSAYAMGRYFLLAGALLVVMLSIAASLLMTRHIVHALTEVIEIAEQIAKGNLTQHVRQGGRNETGQLLNAIADMQQALTQTILQIRENAALVSTNSHDIAQGSANIASRTEQQAASLEQTSSAMEELSATVRQNADNAHAGGQVAEDTTNKAQQGHEIINELVKRVQVIESGSQKIIEVITLIDNVAFQTNLLALNASVEAARAGEQGRGFAVVAGEVRTLAQQCANASKEIGGLIRSNVESVGEGVSLAHQASQSMNTIVTAIQKMAQLSHEISTASQEQRDGVAQIEIAINELDQATQQNVSLVEQSALSANTLHEQSVSMERTVARFRLEQKA